MICIILYVLFIVFVKSSSPALNFSSSSYHYFQLNLTLYDDNFPFVMDMWRNPSSDIEKNFLDDPEDADWKYRDEYVNNLQQGYRTLQAYQTQRFILERDIISVDNFASVFDESRTQTAISITLSYIVDAIQANGGIKDICFWGDVSFQHIFQFSQACQTCNLRYHSATASGHAINHQKTISRLRSFMKDPTLLSASTIGKCFHFRKL